MNKETDELMELLFFLESEGVLDAYVENLNPVAIHFDLSSAFDWMGTPQGDNYWYDLFIKLDGERKICKEARTKKFKVSKWINLYADGTANRSHSSKENAERLAFSGKVETREIILEWEVEE